MYAAPVLFITSMGPRCKQIHTLTPAYCVLIFLAVEVSTVKKTLLRKHLQALRANVLPLSRPLEVWELPDLTRASGLRRRREPALNDARLARSETSLSCRPGSVRAPAIHSVVSVVTVYDAGKGELPPQ